MQEYTSPIPFKKPDLSRFNFTVTESVSEQYGEQVAITAKLLGRPFFQLHKIFEKEGWTLEEITSAYQNATKHSGNCAPEIAWWANRKRRNKVGDN